MGISRRDVGFAYRAFHDIYTMDGIRTVEDGMKMFVEMYPVNVLKGVRDLAALVLDKVSRRPDHSLSQRAVLEVERLSHVHGELTKYLCERGHPDPQPETSIEYSDQ